VIEPGKTGAYFALFTEIGFILFVPTLLGALAGHWLDQQLGLTFPVALLIGLLLGLAAGARVAWRLINRFLATIDD
jgi:predicted ABC-type sugar transport system permease subunit